MTTAVITLVAGRHTHLRRQQWGLSVQTRRPDLVVVVCMDDPVAAAAATAGPLPGPVLTVPVPVRDGRLPLAAARNAGAAAALAAGAATLVFLDVDCIPSAGLVARYGEVATDGVLHCGGIRYLSAAESELPITGFHLGRLAGSEHPARPEPAAGSVDSADWQLFWSLSFAVAAPTWRRLGGFDERYAGYGGEDTDFAYRAHRAGIGLRWEAGATAFHQFHPTRTPPVDHLADIVRNANLFFDSHGFFPMTGWLAAFAERGLATLDEKTGRWAVC
jgi:hypothetical protein